jgi:hypothetical protein
MTDKTKPKPEVHFIYRKSPSFRNYHVDGIYGGITGRGFLQLDFFVEKHPLPDEETYSIDQKGLSLENKKSSTSVIREVEGGLVMDYNMMKSLKAWLDDKINTFENNFIAPKQPTQKH